MAKLKTEYETNHYQSSNVYPIDTQIKREQFKQRRSWSSSEKLNIQSSIR